jgi:hypothetical protein
MTRDEMLAALQRDVDAWPQRVKDAGVKNSAGAAYVPLPRNNEILRTPHDRSATYAYMIRVWQDAGAETGSDGWYRIIEQAGPELTWEWLMVDDALPYASLFPADIRERVGRALEADAGHRAWIKRQQGVATAERARSERIQRIREEMRSGKRKRLRLPDLDGGRERGDAS